MTVRGILRRASGDHAGACPNRPAEGTIAARSRPCCQVAGFAPTSPSTRECPAPRISCERPDRSAESQDRRCHSRPIRPETIRSGPSRSGLPTVLTGLEASATVCATGGAPRKAAMWRGRHNALTRNEGSGCRRESPRSPDTNGPHVTALELPLGGVPGRTR
jgi:hypothetical protein